MKTAGSVRRRRHEGWLKEYAAWVTSGRKQAAFCESRGYWVGTFKSRMKRLREVGLIEPGIRRSVHVRSANSGEQVSGGGFARIHLEGVPTLGPVRPTEPYCEIRFRDAGRLAIEEAAGIERFRELLLASAR